MDFGDVKVAVRSICKSMNEYFICPMYADCVTLTEADQQICLECEDGAKFAFPRGDVLLLPIVHSSAEELAHYLWYTIIRSAHNDPFLLYISLKLPH